MRFVVVLVGPFQPLIPTGSATAQPPFPTSSCLSTLPHSYKALQGFDHPKQTTKKQIQSIEDNLVWSSWIFKVTTSSREGCLNTLRLFSLGGELH